MAFRSHYTDEQKRAVVTAGTRAGLTAPEIVAHAHAGTLDAGLPAFTVPVGTVRDWLAAARAREARAATDPAQVLAGVALGVADELAAMLAKARRRQAKTSVDATRRADELRAIARAGREALALQRETRPPRDPTPADTAPDPPPSIPDIVDQLAGELHGEHEAPATPQAEDQQDDDDGRRPGALADDDAAALLDELLSGQG